MSSEPQWNEDLDANIVKWLSAARAGSHEALGNLLETFRQYLALLARHANFGELRPKFGGSDVVQDTFLEAQRDFADFRGENRVQLQAWLRRLLLNNLMNARRSFHHTKKRSVGRERPWPGGQQAEQWHPAVGDLSPSDHAIHNEQLNRLKSALARLPEHYQTVIVLRNQQHLSFAEIGAQMNRSEDGARMLWARAFQRLAAELEECP